MGSVTNVSMVLTGQSRGYILLINGTDGKVSVYG
jgi:hypothetical protein